jgi:hypothetical protein
MIAKGQHRDASGFISHESLHTVATVHLGGRSVSFDYFVAVHGDKWPTAKSVQTALERLAYPISLALTPNEAFSIEKAALGIPVIFEGRSVLLEADIDQATDANDPESLRGYIAKSAAPDFAISNGDYFLTLTFRSDADQIRAGLYLAAAMILAFEGYGFENQFETHGRGEFANQLVAEASDAAAFDDP